MLCPPAPVPTDAARALLLGRRYAEAIEVLAPVTAAASAVRLLADTHALVGDFAAAGATCDRLLRLRPDADARTQRAIEEVTRHQDAQAQSRHVRVPALTAVTAIEKRPEAHARTEEPELETPGDAATDPRGPIVRHSNVKASAHVERPHGRRRSHGWGAPRREQWSLKPTGRPVAQPDMN